MAVDCLVKSARCKLAFYCCKDHQVKHWKSVHKFDCFSEHDNRSCVLALFYADPLDTKESILRFGQQQMAARAGVGVYLGLSTTNPTQKRIVVDFWTQLDNTEIARAAPPDLYMPPVPPAVVDKARASSIADDEQIVTDSTCIELCIIHQDDDTRSKIQNHPSNEFRYCVEALFIEELGEERRQEALAFLSKQLQLAHWRACIDHPDHLVQAQANSLVGRVLRLEGGIEMVYISSPIPCFADLTSAELDWFNGANHAGSINMSPIIKVPVVAYRCVEEDWLVIRLDSKKLKGPFTLNATKRTYPFERDAIFFKVFLAAAEFGDVASIQTGLFGGAKSFSITDKKEELFLAAANKLLSLLLKRHPQPRRENCYFLDSIAVVHDARAAGLLKNKQYAEAREESLAALRCYHTAAVCTQQFYPNRLIRGHRYITLAVALMNVGFPELAKRGFLWALSDPVSWLPPLGTQSLRLAIIHNLGKLWEDEQLPEQQRQFSYHRALKDFGKYLRKAHQDENIRQRPHAVNCLNCKQALRYSRFSGSVCSRCKEPYCTSECLLEDWPNHKKTCKLLKNATSEPISKFEHIGGCTDATMDLLAGANLIDAKHSMTLSEGARRAAVWKRNQPTEVDIPAPTWLHEYTSMSAP